MPASGLPFAQVDDRRDRFVITPHHPDRLRRPPAPPGASARERHRQALTWNVFRALELLPPAFWLRRLQTRLVGDPSWAAPQMVRVSLWQPAPLPPAQRIDGALPDVIVDVVIETEHALWTLMAVGGIEWAEEEKAFARVLDAGAWLAGLRAHYCGVIEAEASAASIGAVLRSRHSRSRESIRLRSAARGPAAPSGSSVGAVRWADLEAILRDAAEAQHLSPVERAAAQHTLAWLAEVGIPEGRTAR